MDHLQTRLETLEQQMHTVNRRLRWWRSLACVLIGVALLTLALPSGTAQEAQKKKKSLEERVAALEDLFKHFTREGKEVTITGANLHLINGLGSTGCGPEGDPIPDCPNGLGNLIVGYNEPRPPDAVPPDLRTGSHNIVVGQEHNFSRFGGIVVGFGNEINGDFAAVSGGQFNTASGLFTSVSGGQANTARDAFTSVSGGKTNNADGNGASISGGFGNTTAGNVSWVGGGQLNSVSGVSAAVSGGELNTASGNSATVGGGRERTAEGEFDWVAGSLFGDK
jgi:hypothetical protein